MISVNVCGGLCESVMLQNWRQKCASLSLKRSIFYFAPKLMITAWTKLKKLSGGRQMPRKRGSNVIRLSQLTLYLIVGMVLAVDLSIIVKR